MSQCPICLRPLATEADEALVDRGDKDAEVLLCWTSHGYDDINCRPPEWWETVTPMGVQTLRADLEQANRLIASVIGSAHLSATRVKPLWVCVRDLFCVGSTRAQELCAAHGYDPDQGVTIHVRAVKRADKATSTETPK